MPLDITNPAITPFSFADFFEPAGSGGPDSQNFFKQVDWTANDPTEDYSVHVKGLTNNFGNVDWFGNDPALVTINTPVFHDLTGLGGSVDISVDVPNAYYERIGEGEHVQLRFRVKVTDNLDASSDSVVMKINLFGTNDPCTAVNDRRTITDKIASFDDGTVLADDFDIDIHDTLGITNAKLSGPVMPAGGTVFPAEYVAMKGGTVGHDADSIQFNANPYFQFLAAGEKATFRIKYTISDGHGATDSAFLKVTIKGTDTDTFVGTGKSEEMLGEDNRDSMFGGAGGDTIFGRAGKDVLSGQGGRDTLVGGLGPDRLYGGSKADVFDFNSKLETGLSGSKRDKIMDFHRGSDLIDLSDIDARSGSGNQAFNWIGAQGFHGVKGELHYLKSGGNVIVEGDINGDGAADFAIQVNNLSKLAASDFHL